MEARYHRNWEAGSGEIGKKVKIQSEMGRVVARLN